ncbi:MAG: hypothetical protein FJ379_06120 [Verrucomicrobia bacterium]|nr:hypothetical protein [Verrucomicrobiota bacterium]
MSPLPFLRCLTAIAALAVLSQTPVQARILDDFKAAERSGWKDANPAGQPLPGGKQSGGVFTFDLPTIGQSFFVSSTKTSETFELVEGRTVEYRVDLVSGRGGDSFAVLAFIPQATGANSLAGYGIAKSETDLLITKGINKYFFNENVQPAVKNQNVTLVLNLEARSGNVIIRGQVLDRDAGNAVIWEKTFIDTPAADVMANGADSPPAPFLNLVGNFVLYLYADGGKSPEGYQVVFDNAQVFVADGAVLDDFKATERSGWKDANPAGQPLPGGKQSGGVFTFDLPAIGQAFFVSSTKTTKTYELTEGTLHEFAVDLVSGQGPDSFAVLAFIPQKAGANSLGGYGIAKSESDLLITKGINKYFFNENVSPAIKSTNVRLVLTLTTVDGTVLIRGRVLDLDAGGAVLFDRTFIDTPEADVLANGTDSPPAPFTNLVGNVVLYLYADGGKDPNGYQVVYRNLNAAAPPTAVDEAPRIDSVLPAEGSVFLAADTKVAFSVVDDRQLPDAGFKVTLNGVDYTAANGLLLGPAGTTRSGTLGGFEKNKSYLGQLAVTDSGGTTRTAMIAFDTFSPDTRTVDVEDYDFDVGQFFDNPVRSAEGGGVVGNSYTDRVGVAGTDYQDTRSGPSGGDTPYRTQDAVQMQRSLDNRRPSLFNNDQGIYDYEVGDIAVDDWMNYTREFPAGSYEVYLRESVVNMEKADSVLEEVSSAVGTELRLLGSFLGVQSGFTARNVPLTDGTGRNRIVLRLSGKKTLRLRHLTPDNETGARYINYLVFVPVADAGVQRAAVTSVSPTDGAVVDTTEPRIDVSIQNRDTQIKTSSIQLSVNGVAVTPKVNAVATGLLVSYVLNPLPARGVVQQARLVFADNEGVLQTNTWAFTVTYLELDPATRLPGPGSERGFKVRSTQAGETGENSLDRAEAQLAPNSSIPALYNINVVSQTINFSQEGSSGGSAGYFEGDEPIPGQDDALGDDNYAMEVVAFLDLPAGVTRFGVRSDDGYKLAAGLNLGAGSPPLAFHNGGPADETFDVVVQAAGVYGIRLVWYERSGGAHVELFTVDRSSGERTLVNAAGGIKAYTSARAAASVETVGSATLDGTYMAVAGAVVDTQARTVTVPAGGSVQFLRLSSTSPITVTGVSLSGGSLVIRYQ